MRDMRLWTRQFFQSNFDLPTDYWVVNHLAFARTQTLLGRRDELRRYELESWAALAKKWEWYIRQWKSFQDDAMRKLMYGDGEK